MGGSSSMAASSFSIGSKDRYAIGIRDINVYSIVFQPKGEIISRAFVSINEIKKAILDSSQNPVRYSELASIQYFISPNDGQDWHEIQSRAFMGSSGVVSTIPENVLAFLRQRLLRSVRAQVLDDIVRDKLAEVEQELRDRLQPEVERLTIEHITVAHEFLNNRFQLLVGWNYNVTATHEVENEDGCRRPK
jgi:hypothetical protein